MKNRNNNITTIKVKKEIKTRLDNFRIYRRETYNDILEKIFEILSICRTNPEAARNRLFIIEKEKISYSLPKTKSIEQTVKDTPDKKIYYDKKVKFINI